MQEPDEIETLFQMMTVQLNLAALGLLAMREKGLLTASEARGIALGSIGRCDNPNPMTRLLCAELLRQFPE